MKRSGRNDRISKFQSFKSVKRVNHIFSIKGWLSTQEGTRCIRDKAHPKQLE